MCHSLIERHSYRKTVTSGIVLILAFTDISKYLHILNKQEEILHCIDTNAWRFWLKFF